MLRLQTRGCTTPAHWYYTFLVLIPVYIPYYKMSRHIKYAPGSPLPKMANGLPGTLCQTMVSCNYDMETLGLRWVILREDGIVLRIFRFYKWRIKYKILGISDGLNSIYCPFMRILDSQQSICQQMH